MKISIITQARFGSSRLPGKVLKTINNKSLLEIHLERALKSQLATNVIVATTKEPEVENICLIAEKLGVKCFRGDTNDVLDRFYQAVKNEQTDYVVRITSDCPLIDYEVIDALIKFTIDGNYDYCSNTLNPTFPDGMDVEVFKFEALHTAWLNADSLSDREHVTPYIWRNSSFNCGELFTSENYQNDEDFSKIRLTVDELSDFKVIENLIFKLGDDKPWISYVIYLEENPDLLNLNLNIVRNEGYLKSLKRDINIKKK